MWSFIHAAHSAGWHVELITRPSDCLPPARKVHFVHTCDQGPDFDAHIPALRRIHRIRPYRYGLWSLAVAEQLMRMAPHFDAVEFVDSRAEGFVALTSGRVREHWSGVPMYVRAHAPMFLIESLSCFDPHRFGRQIYHNWERAALDAADGISTPSTLVRRTLDLADAAVIPPILQDVDASRAPICKGRLLFVGIIEPNKGPDVWVRSLNIVLRRHMDAVAEMIGPDTCTAPDGGSMVAHALSLIEPNLRCRFSWRGPAAPAAVRDAISRAVAVIVPSRFESFSYVAAEAILACRPVIVSDAVGIAEYAPTIPLARYGDFRALADLQDRILNDEHWRNETANRCRHELRAHGNTSQTLAQTADFIRSLQGRAARAEARDDHDAMDAMAVFLHSVENAATRSSSALREDSIVKS